MCGRFTHRNAPIVCAFAFRPRWAAAELSHNRPQVWRGQLAIVPYDDDQKRRSFVALIQYINVFLLHSWLAATLPFTPTQNANLLVSISTCITPDLMPISELAVTCGKPGDHRLALVEQHH
jgi:hypothetical protein